MRGVLAGAAAVLCCSCHSEGATIEVIEVGALELDSVTFCGGLFVAHAPDRIVSSFDGVTWKDEKLGGFGVGGVSCDGRRFIFSGGGAGVSGVFFAEPRSPLVPSAVVPTPFGLQFIAYRDGQYVGAGTNGIVSAGPSMDWKVGFSGTFNFRSIEVGPHGAIAQVAMYGGSKDTNLETYASVDLQTWQSVKSVYTDESRLFYGHHHAGSAFGRDRWVTAHSSAGTKAWVAVSRASLGGELDPESFTLSKLPFDFDIHRIRFLHGAFYAVGWNGTVLVSPDGVEFSQLASFEGVALEDVAYGNGVFVAVGRNKVLRWSVTPFSE